MNKKVLFRATALGTAGWAIALGTLFGTGVATIDHYNGTYGVSVGGQQSYCSADVTIVDDFVTSFSCQNPSLTTTPATTPSAARNSCRTITMADRSDSVGRRGRHNGVPEERKDSA